MKRFISCLLSCAALAGLAGCTHGVAISTPPGFAELGSNGSYDYRAADSRGVAIAVRREANDPSADLAFWAGAVDAQLRRDGYQAMDAADVHSADGIEGRQIRYTVAREGRAHVFMVVVYVTDTEVVTVEAGGDAELVKDQEKALSRAIGSLDLSS
jgi:hypothetical protein